MARVGSVGSIYKMGPISYQIVSVHKTLAAAQKAHATLYRSGLGNRAVILGIGKRFQVAGEIRTVVGPSSPLQMLRHHVSSAIARGEKEAIVEQRGNPRRKNPGGYVTSLPADAIEVYRGPRNQATNKCNILRGRGIPCYYQAWAGHAASVYVRARHHIKALVVLFPRPGSDLGQHGGR